MPLVPYPIQPKAIAEVALEYKLNNQQNIAVLHYSYDDTPVIDDGYAFLGQLINKLTAVDGVYPKFRNCLSEDAGTVNLYAQWIHPSRFAYRTLVGPEDATGPAGAAPQNVAAAITKKGILAERGAVGTLHMGAVPLEWIVNGMIVQPVGNPYQELADEIAKSISVLDVDDMVPCLYKRSDPAESVIIAEAFLELTSRIMRRRTVGLGT